MMGEEVVESMKRIYKTKSGRGWEPELAERFAFDGRRPQVPHCSESWGGGGEECWRQTWTSL